MPRPAAILEKINVLLSNNYKALDTEVIYLFAKTMLYEACIAYYVFQCFMEPLKKVQVEGHLMFAEPQDLFGNLDELCYVRLPRCSVAL